MHKRILLLERTTKFLDMPSKRVLHEFKQILYCVKNEEHESNRSLRMMMDSFQTQLADPQEQARIGITYLLMSIKPLRAKVDVAIVGDRMVFVVSSTYYKRFVCYG